MKPAGRVGRTTPMVEPGEGCRVPPKRGDAAAANVDPVSPSPIRASSASSRSRADANAADVATMSPRSVGSSEGWARVGEDSAATGLISSGPGLRTPGHAAVGSAGANKADRTSSSSGRTDTENPCMESDVIRGRGPTRSSDRAPSSVSNRSLATMFISRVETLPRLLISTASGRSAGTELSSSSAIRLTRCRTSPMATSSRPGSPWMPSPSSTMPSANVRPKGRNGMCAPDAETPIVRTPWATRRATASTSAKVPPDCAVAPATL